MEKIKVSPKQNVVTIGKQKYKFVDNNSLSCSSCALSSLDYCPEIPCSYIYWDKSVLSRNDKKNGIFIKK